MPFSKCLQKIHTLAHKPSHKWYQQKRYFTNHFQFCLQKIHICKVFPFPLK